MKTNNNDLISIVVPIYNVEKYLNKCIDSILSQEYKNIEIILVDDGSTDNSGKICDDYTKKDNRIKVIHKENGGLSDARNVGMEKAIGEYIAFIDSDDYIGKDYISTLYNMCITNNSEIAQCSFERVTDNQTTNEINVDKKIENMTGIEAIKNIFKEKYLEYIVAWNKLYKKSLFENIKYPKGKLHEDEATTYKLFYEAKKVSVTNEKLYYYYIRQNSITNTKFTLKRLDYIEELEEQLKFFNDRNEKEIYLEVYYRYSRSLLLFYLKCKTMENSEQIQNELYNKYKESVKYLKSKKEINLKRKLILQFGLTFPKLYRKIFIKD